MLPASLHCFPGKELQLDVLLSSVKIPWSPGEDVFLFVFSISVKTWNYLKGELFFFVFSAWPCCHIYNCIIMEKRKIENIKIKEGYRDS